MGFMDEYYKALQEPKQNSGSTGHAVSNSNSSYLDEYNKVIGSNPVARPAVFRPGVDTGRLITLPFRPGVDNNKLTTLPFRPGNDSGKLVTLPHRVSKDERSTIKDKIESRLTLGNKKDEEEEKKWYQKGHFEDGYDFGDVTKTILGIDEDSASLKDLTVGSLKRGYYNSLYGEESFKEMLGEANEKEALKEKLESEEYQFAPGNDFAGAVSGAFEQIGQMGRQFTNPRTLGFTGSAIGAAIIAGNAGPQALVPEEIVSVPAVATAAFKASSAASNFEIEAGHAYNEMIELGIKEDIAKNIALAVGAGNAGFELAQTGDLIDAYKATGKKEATQSVAKLIVKELADRGVDVLTETAQEDVQELITIGGVQAANWLDKGKFAYTAQEVGERLWDTTKSSALSFGMMNVPATAKNTYSIIKDNKNVPVSQTVQNDHPIVEQIPKVEQEIKPEVEEVKPVIEVKPPEKKVLYTGSPNTDIKQFKVGGVDGSKQTGDRYGRGVYLTTNENTAKNYAGDSGRVYQISADDLNIFNLNDTITPEMRDSLIAVFKGGDTQFRNSMLRNFRTEMTFDDFESAEAFFDHQRKVWKEQDGEYSANKPEIKEADHETGRAVIEFTDFENWENNIGTLTGNHLYDALKSLSTDDFSSFITGHGFDGIAFDEDSENQQYVIYRNEDRLHIVEGAEEQTATDQDVAPAVKEPLTTEEAPTISETEMVEEDNDEPFDWSFLWKSENSDHLGYDPVAESDAYVYERRLNEQEKAMYESAEADSIEPDSVSDSSGRKLSETQGKYFHDSKARDNSGKLIPLYHGTSSDFTVFDPNKTGQNFDGWSELGKGIYLTTSKFHAQNYSNGGKVLELYADIKKPFHTNEAVLFDLTDLVAMGFPAHMANHLRMPGGGYFLVNEASMYGIDASAYLQSKGYDGIWYHATVDEDADQIVVFDSSQVKSVDNLNPTSSPDIFDSISEDLTNAETETDIAPVTEDFSAPEVAVAENETTTTPELQNLYDERQVLQDTIMSRVEVNQVDETTEMLAKKWGAVDSRIRSMESQEGNIEGDAQPIVDSNQSSNVEGLVRKFVQQDYGDIDESISFEADGFVVRRDLSSDGKRWTYSITSSDGRQTRGTTDVDYIDFWDTVTDKLNRFSEGDVGDAISPIPAEAPVRVVSTDKGDFLQTDKNGFEDQTKKPIPRQPKVLTEQPPVQTNQQSKKTDSKAADSTPPKTSDSLNVEHKKLSPLKWLGEYVVDHGFWVERLSKKTGNRELDAKWNFIRYARGGAQHLIGKGSEANGVKSLKSMLNRVDKAGLTGDFYNYMYHWLNFDRMTVEERYPNSQNIGVFGDAFSASDSLKLVQQYEQAHPEFKNWAEDVYAYNRFLRSKLVEAGIISQKTADLWEDRFPHYVPVKRASFTELEADFGNARKAGFDSSVHEFEGSDKDILPLFDTMAERTLSVYRATAMNGFASELYDTLYPGYSKNHNGSEVPFDFYLDDLDPREELVQSGQLGSLPTLTYYQDGKRHTFDISSEMYESLKPASDWLSYKAPAISDFSNLRRALITEYNPWFVLKNAIKDVQDIVINSQHPLETYANLIAKAPMEMATNGLYYQEYLENGGNQNTYFDKENVSYDTDKGLVSTLKKVTGLEAISKANNIVEMLPRFAEYIASREAGRSIEESMLDASRVTTNFAAGGKFTKLLNRNGATFLNASVQGFVQQARNIVEAKQNGLKGMAGLAARYLAAGIPVFVLNNLVWEDDEEYKELPDYITNNYYIVGKYGDGKFVRLPKGRTAAVIQNAVEQVAKMSSGDDEADWNEFYKIFMENIAPNNPGEDNVFAPIKQVIENKTWYGEDLVPSRLMVTRDEDGNLKEVPTIERHDEKTDSISIWLSEKLQDVPGLKNLELSPKQINYLLDQYTGVVGDTVLPFFTPKAESPSDSFLGKAISPLRDIFTTDSVLNNRVTGDFYDTLEAAEAQAESKNATQEDKLRSGILISANVEISELLKEQRKIQTSDLPDSEKYQRNRELKEEINALQKDALDSLQSVFMDGIYAEAGDKRYNFGYDTENEQERWFEIKPKTKEGEDNWYYIQEKLSHDKLGMSYSDFWNGRKPPEDFEGKTYYAEYGGKRYNYDVDDNSWYVITPKTKDGEDNYYYQQEQLAHDKLGVPYEDFWNNREAYMDANYVADRWGEPFYETVKNVFGAKHFADFAAGMADVSADKDANGNPINGSRKKKMEAYIYGLDIPDIEKHILFKSQYSYTNKHNYEIINYLNERDDISYEEMESVLKELGFSVDSNGRITW